MTIVACLLRGINVGGHGRLPMADLRTAAEEVGMSDVATYIQSGNLIGIDDDPSTLPARLGDAIEARVGFRPGLVLRTADALRAAVEAAPFGAVDPNARHVTFIDQPAAPLLAGFDAAGFAPEACAAIDDDLHLYLPDGIGRSPLATALARRSSSAVATTRNWRTVLAVVALVDQRA